MAITRISTDVNGVQGNGDSNAPVFSPDGNKVAFVSAASNLVDGDTNGVADIFVWDRRDNSIVRVNTAVGGGQASGGASANPVFSPDGNSIAFSSAATNLVTGDTNGVADIFVKNLTTGAITRVSTTSSNGEATGGVAEGSITPSFSPDGTKIAFASNATNLVSGDTNNQRDIFIKNLSDNSVTRVNTSSSGAQGQNGTSSNPQFSPDGTKIAFISGANNLIANDTNGTSGDLFIKDLTTQSITLVNTDSSGVQSANGVTGFRWSPTGNKIAFTTSSPLVSGDTNNALDIYLKDFTNNTLTRVNTDANGNQATGGTTSGQFLSFSADGNKIAFSSSATNLVPNGGDTNGQADVFVKNLTTNAIDRVSITSSGGQATGGSSSMQSLSPDGSRVAFTSTATNLVSNDSNGALDVFAADAVCFATGTRIRTVSGDVAVEALAVGDMVVTRDGRRKPIRWIGHRHVACARHPEPAKVHPVRVKAGSFGSGLPTADLWLSRNHALCLDDSLVPVRGLIDGEKIAQVPQAEVTYWHVELDGHDVILANGLPAESYLDTGNRHGFANAEASLLHFDEESAAAYDGSGYCLPLVESGPRLSAIRARYGLGRAACAEQVDGTVHLVADGATIVPLAASANELRFVVPAGAGELRLVSPSFQAAGADVRRLGVIVGGLAVSDGAGWREIALDAPGLYAGFHDVERWPDKAWRWTDGEAHLASGLWAGLSGPVLLRLTGQFSGLKPVAAAEADEALRAA